MYPLLLSAPVKDYIWGGRRLIDDFGFKTEKEIAAEAWVLSCHKDGESTVKNGAFAGMKLSEVLEKWGVKGIGKNAAAFPYFPLLIKLIDAKDRLSVQVHPSDEYALKNENEYGKTEMWYVVDCEEGASLIYGFKQNISKQEFETRIRNNTLSQVCNFVPVKKGDIFFIEAGTLHAIGKGILIAEIQQNSNTTYRVSDYGRLGADGKPRPLHIHQALDVTKTAVPDIPYGDVGELTLYPFGLVRNLAKCDLFTADLMTVNGNAGICEKDSFVSLLVLEGNAVLSYPLGNMSVKKGDSVLVPANMRVTVTGNTKIICSHV
ncbi:MAG: class I mannose-6-phosphate isomerase [Clostridia bacterium]|nr:class I mannose-6-phosphate isomerase [Clostridia bacterium]